MEKLHYFLGANSPQGFYGYFQKAYGPEWRVWLIKGGPGSGKSTLMRNAAHQIRADWEYIHCSSDPKSLDAVICEDKKVMIADATAPHAMEPLRPGCVETLVDLGAGFDVDALRRDRAQIDRLFAENALLHRQAVHYLSAAAQVKRVRLELAMQTLDKAAVRRCAESYAKLLDTGGSRGVERLRGLSAVTPDGIIYYADTVGAVADSVFAVLDDWGAAAPLFMEEMRCLLRKNCCAVTVCRCSLFPKERIEHILLPQQKTAFVTQNTVHAVKEAAEWIDLQDMYGAHRPGTKDALQRILTQENQLLEAASGFMYQARMVHDELEAYYIRAMDFSFAEKRAEELIFAINDMD